jgi:hypothetical protein
MELMRKKGIDAVAIAGQFDIGKLPDMSLGVNFANKDYSPAANGFDHIVVINVRQLGVARNHAPTFPPAPPGPRCRASRS